MNRMPDRGKCFGNRLIGTLPLNKKSPEGKSCDPPSGQIHPQFYNLIFIQTSRLFNKKAIQPPVMQATYSIEMLSIRENPQCCHAYGTATCHPPPFSTPFLEPVANTCHPQQTGLLTKPHRNLRGLFLSAVSPAHSSWPDNKQNVHTRTMYYLRDIVDTMLVVYLIHQNFFDIRYTLHNLNTLKFSIFYMQTLNRKDIG